MPVSHSGIGCVAQPPARGPAACRGHGDPRAQLVARRCRRRRPARRSSATRSGHRARGRGGSRTASSNDLVEHGRRRGDDLRRRRRLVGLQLSRPSSHEATRNSSSSDCGARQSGNGSWCDSPPEPTTTTRRSRPSVASTAPTAAAERRTRRQRRQRRGEAVDDERHDRQAVRQQVLHGMGDYRGPPAAGPRTRVEPGARRAMPARAGRARYRPATVRTACRARRRR